MLWQITIALFLIFFSIKFFQNRKFIKHMNTLPGPKGYPIIGVALDFWGTPEKAFQTFRQYAVTYYPFYTYWMLYVPVFNLLMPEDIEILMGSMKHSKKSSIYELLHPWLGTGLLTSEGSKWQHRRKLLTPTFHFNILKNFMEVFVKHSQSLTNQLNKECHKQYTDIVPLIQNLTLRTICETAMGTQLDDVNNNFKEYSDNILREGELIFQRLRRPWLYHNFFYFFTSGYWKNKSVLKVLHNFTKSIIAEKENNYLNTTNLNAHEPKNKRLAMLDLLFKLKYTENSIDIEGIREEVDTFTFEGHDTTAACLTYTLMLLANEKDVQEKLYEEIQEVFEDITDSPKFEELQKLTYMEQVIKESLRLYPSVHFISRVTDSDVELHSGFMIPKESIVQIHIFDVHHNANIYPDPYKFDPERFSAENINKRHPFAYIPFSAGPRNCIGRNFAMLELKVVISEIIKNFILEPIDKPSDIVHEPHLVLKSKQNIRVKFNKR